MNTAVRTAVDTFSGMILSPSVAENLHNQTLHALRLVENNLSGTFEQLNVKSLHSSSTLNELTQYPNLFRDEIKSVEKLELRMAIIGTMKAGKSTILNGIMGYDLLPSRNTAMTTLPTEILFSQHTEQPELILKSELISTIDEISRKLQLKSSDCNLSTRLRNEQDLMIVMQHISANKHITLEFVTCGQSKIVDSLKYINDVVLPLRHSTSIPQGEFIIVDTPGPNDSNLTAHLRQIVISELQKAALILVALEFIGSDSTAEVELMKDIKTIQEYREMGVPSCLYALVNKIDQYIEGKHNPVKETEAAVAMKYNIPLANVHGVSAMNALISYTFRQEYEEIRKKSDVTHERLMRETNSYRMFMQQALGQTWEQAAKYINANLLPNIAEELWKKSNYDSFLHNTLGIVSQHIIPICLTTALQKCIYYIGKSYEKINIRKSCLDINEKPLLETLSRFEYVHRELHLIQKKAEENTHQWRCDIIKFVDESFDEAASRSKHVVTEILDDESTEHSSSHWKKLLIGKDILYFNTKDDADLFFETFFYSIKDVSESLMHALNWSIYEKVNRMCFAFQNHLQLATNDICDSIGMHLKLLLGFEVIHFESVSKLLNITNFSSALTETQVVVSRRLWYFLWLVKGKCQVKMNQLSKKQLEHTAVDTLKENFKKLKQYAIDETENRLQKVFRSHFDSIEKYLLEQSNNIQMALDDKKLEKKAMKNQFNDLLNTLSINKDYIENTLKEINKYFKN
ncbi:unnamed protein product [Rotaria socialis]